MPAGCFVPTPLGRLETISEQRNIREVAEDIFTDEELYDFPNEVVVTKKDKRYKENSGKIKVRTINKNNTILHIYFPERLIDVHKKGYEDKINRFIEAYKEKFGENYLI